MNRELLWLIRTERGRGGRMLLYPTYGAISVDCHFKDFLLNLKTSALLILSTFGLLFKLIISLHISAEKGASYVQWLNWHDVFFYWAGLWMKQVLPSHHSFFTASHLQVCCLISPVSFCWVHFLWLTANRLSNSRELVGRKESAVVLEVCGPNW